MTTIIMPTVNPEQAEETAAINTERAGAELETWIIVDEHREGYTKTVNRGLAKAPGDVCIIVDDAVLSEGWLKTFQEEIAKRKALTVWFAGPSMRCRTPPQNRGRPGDCRRPKIVPHLSGAALYATAEAVEAGLMDERLIHYASDIDWQWRVRGRSLWIPSVWCDHELHEPANLEWWQHDQKLLYTKWPGRT